MLIVLKYGGNAMTAGADDPVLDEIAALARGGMSVVLVHGGGPQIDAALRAQGIREERVEGLRVTSAAARDIVEAVLCGSVNKDLVRGTLGARRAGVRFFRSGRRAVDGAAHAGRWPRPGLRGRTRRGRRCAAARRVGARRAAGDRAASVSIRSDGAGLNVNADTVAGAIAAALQADAYVVLTNVAGVRRDRDDPASVIPRLTIPQAQGFIDDGTFSDGHAPEDAGGDRGGVGRRAARRDRSGRSRRDRRCAGRRRDRALALVTSAVDG